MRFRFLAAIYCIVSSLSAFGIDKIPAFEPTLTLAREKQLCDTFLNVWQSAFDGSGGLHLTEEHLSKDAAILDTYTFPPGGTDQPVIDIDRDGVQDHIWVEAFSRGWRPAGTRIFLFRDKQHLSETKLYATEQLGLSFLSIQRLELAKHQHGAIEIANSWDQFLLFTTVDRTYLVEVYPRDTKSRLFLLGKDNAGLGKPLCEVQVKPDQEAITDLTNRFNFLDRLAPIYGGPGGCRMGSMGWTASPPSSRLSEVFYRPQSLGDSRPRESYSREIISEGLRNTQTELRAISWGLKDPTSWQTYLELREEIPRFLKDLSHYYQHHFGAGEEQAEQWAIEAYYFLMDNLIYARNNDSWSITSMSVWPGASYGLSPVYNLSLLAENTQRSFMLLVGDGKPWGGLSNSSKNWGILDQIIQLQIYTNQSLEKIDQLWQSTVIQNKDDPFIPSPKLLSAAIHRPEVLRFLVTYGAKVNDPSTAFEKTALMYAAQHGEAESVTYLLSAGANPNLKTKSNICPVLERDSRTALMYAAENGTISMVEDLIRNGADVCAKDSQGNSIEFYAQRNTFHNSILERIETDLRRCDSSQTDSL